MDCPNCGHGLEPFATVCSACGWGQRQSKGTRPGARPGGWGIRDFLGSVVLSLFGLWGLSLCLWAAISGTPLWYRDTGHSSRCGYPVLPGAQGAHQMPAFAAMWWYMLAQSLVMGAVPLLFAIMRSAYWPRILEMVRRRAARKRAR